MKKTFTSIKDHANFLLKSCWLPLDNFLKPSLLKKLDIINIPKEERHTDEITLLGELASYPKDTIKKIKGIGPKNLILLEKTLTENNLDWNIPMTAIRTLADDF